MRNNNPKKIIIPKGLVDPNETTIVEIPEELQDEQSLIASPKANTSSSNKNLTGPHSSRTRSSRKGKSNQMAESGSNQSNCPIGGSCCFKSSTSRANTSETDEADYSSIPFESTRLNNTVRSKSPNNNWSFVGSGYFDSTVKSSRTSPARSQTYSPLIGSGYFDSTSGSSARSVRNASSKTSKGMKSTFPESCKSCCSKKSYSLKTSTPKSTTFGRSTDESLGLLGSGYFDTTASTPQSLGTLGSGYFDTTVSSPRTPGSLGILGSGYFDSTASTPRSAGILGPGYFDSTVSSPRRTPQTTFDYGSPEILGSGYFDSTMSSYQSPGLLGSGYFDTTASSDQSAGILGPGYFDSTMSSYQSPGVLGAGYFDTTVSSDQSAGLLGPGFFDSTASSSPSRGGRASPCHCSPRSSNAQFSTPRSNDMNGSLGILSDSFVPIGGEQVLDVDIEEQLALIEAEERSIINRDLRNIQTARRQLAIDATRLSRVGGSPSTTK